jgi:hypothetical protein
MAFLGETIEAGSLPEGRSYDLISEGWYNATITKAEVGQTKSGTGTKIDIRYDITGPTHQGRVMYASVNIRNQSTKAEEIGRQQLGEIMRAVGLARLEDSDQLIGGQVSIKIKIKQPSEQDKANGYTEAKNEVGGWKSTGGSAPVMPAPSATAATAKPPWAK